MSFPKETLRVPTDVADELSSILVKGGFDKMPTSFTRIPTSSTSSSDWLYPTNENKEIVIALNACGANVGFVEINSDKGHDSFLLNVPEFLKILSQFLNSTYDEVNNEKRI